MADLLASSSLRADAPSWQPKAAASVTTPPVQPKEESDSSPAGNAAAAETSVAQLKPAAVRVASPDVASSKAADQEATRSVPTPAASSDKATSNGAASRSSPSSPVAAKASSTTSSSGQVTTRPAVAKGVAPAVPKGVAKVVLAPRLAPRRSSITGSGPASGASSVSSGPPPGLAGGPGPSSSSTPTAADAAPGGSSSGSRGGAGMPANGSCKPDSGPAGPGAASATGKGSYSVQDLVVAIDRAWPDDPDPTAAAEAQVKQVLAHHIVTNPTPNQPAYSILASSANLFLNQQLGVGWREALQLPKIADLLKGDPHFKLGPIIKSNRLITVNAELLLRSAGLSTGGGSSSSSSAAVGAPKAGSRSTDAHVQLSLGKRAAGAAAATTAASSGSSSSTAARAAPAAAGALPASYSKPPGLGAKQPQPQLLARSAGAAGASSAACSAASAAVAVAMAVAAADPATAGYTAAIARHWAGDSSGIAQVQQLVALHLSTCSDFASDTLSVNARLEAELGHNWVKRLQMPLLLDMLQADCFILGPRAGAAHKRSIQLDLGALGLVGKGAPGRAATAAGAPAESGSQRLAKPSAAAPAGAVAVVPRVAAGTAKPGNTAASSGNASSSHPTGLPVPVAGSGAGAVGSQGLAMDPPGLKRGKQASSDLLEVAVHAVADMTASAEAAGVSPDVLSAVARRWHGRHTAAPLLQHMVALQLVMSSDYSGDTTRAYTMVQGWLGPGWREKMALPRLVEVLLADSVFRVGPPALKMRTLVLNMDLLLGKKARPTASAAATGPAAPAAAAAAAASASADTARATSSKGAAAVVRQPPAVATLAAAVQGLGTRATGAQPPSALATSASPQVLRVAPWVLLEQPLALHPEVVLPAVGCEAGGAEALQLDGGALSFLALLPSRLHAALLPYMALSSHQVLRGLVLDQGRPAVVLLAGGGHQVLPPAFTLRLEEALQALAAAQQAPQQGQQRLVRQYLRWRKAVAAAAASASAAGATAGSRRQQTESIEGGSAESVDAAAAAAAVPAVPSSTTDAGAAGAAGVDAAPPLTTQLLHQHDQEQVAAEQVLTAGRRRSAATPTTSSSSSSGDEDSDKGSEGILEFLQALGVDVVEGEKAQADTTVATAGGGVPQATATVAAVQARPGDALQQQAAAAPVAVENQAAAEAEACTEAAASSGKAAGGAAAVEQVGAVEAAASAAAGDGLTGASCASLDGDSSAYGRPCGDIVSSSSSDDEGVELVMDMQLQQGLERALSQGALVHVGGTLHRVCALRGVTGTVTGLTYHVGRHMPQLAAQAGPALGRLAAGAAAGEQAAMLIVGNPGSGKTTLLQSLAAALAAPCAAGGYGLQVLVVLPAAGNWPGLDESAVGAASCWGSCRVVETPAGGGRAAMLAAAQQHMAQVVVVDDLSCAEEAQAAAALLTSGVTLLAAARAASMAHLMSAPSMEALASVLRGPCQTTTSAIQVHSLHQWSICSLAAVGEHLP